MHITHPGGISSRNQAGYGRLGGFNPFDQTPRMRAQQSRPMWQRPAASFFRGHGQVQKPFASYSPFGVNSYQMSQPTEKVSYKEFEHTTNTQNTSLTITTKDGDVVTINLLEKERASSSSSILKQEGVNTGLSEDTEVDAVSLSKTEKESENASIGSLIKDGLFTGEASRRTESFEKSSGEYVNADNDSRTVVRYADTQYSSSDFSFSVEGDLDEDELEAIAGLIDDIDTLSNEFFEGDVKVAFEQAKQMGFDDEEIAQFSLNLRELDTKVVSKSYEQYSAANDQPRLPESVAKPIGHHMHRIERMESVRQRYFEAESIGLMLEEIMASRSEEFDNEEKVNDFMQFHEHMRSLLGFGK